MKKKSLFKNKTKIHHLKSLNELDKIILFFSGQTNFPMFLTTKKNNEQNWPSQTMNELHEKS